MSDALKLKYDSGRATKIYITSTINTNFTPWQQQLIVVGTSDLTRKRTY